MLWLCKEVYILNELQRTHITNSVTGCPKLLTSLSGLHSKQISHMVTSVSVRLSLCSEMLQSSIWGSL